MSYHGRQLVSALARATRYAAISLLCLAGLPSVVSAQSTPRCYVTLMWDEHPETIASFQLDYGTSAGVYTSMVSVPATIVSGNGITVKNVKHELNFAQPSKPTTYYFVLRALDVNNISSGRSNEVSVILLSNCGGTTTNVRIPTAIFGVVAVIVIQGS